MEKLKRKYENTEKALNSLINSESKFQKLDKPDDYYTNLRDSVIKNFEFTIDCFWKLLKEILFISGIESKMGPKGIIKDSAEHNIISTNDAKELINMINDRNTSSHLYQEDTAEEIAQNIERHIPKLKSMLEKIKKNKFLDLKND